MSDLKLNDVFANAMKSIIDEFVFSIPQKELLTFLDYYGFDDSMLLRSRLIALCARPVDIHGFAFACYVLSGSDCKLQTQIAIDEALIAYKRNNFTL